MKIWLGLRFYMTGLRPCCDCCQEDGEDCFEPITMRAYLCFLIVYLFCDKSLAEAVGESPKQFPCWKERDSNYERNVTCAGLYEVSYTPEQCDVTGELCWCVNWKTGKSVSTAYHKKRTVNCFKTLNGNANAKCLREWRDRQLANDAHSPDCDPVSGEYAARQCNTTSDHCWCVGTRTGVEIPQSRAEPIKFYNVDCHYFTYTDSLCMRNQHTIAMTLPANTWTPECDLAGNFNNRQCYGFEAACWCVDSVTGRRIKGSRTRMGANLDCSKFAPPPPGGKCERLHAFYSFLKKAFRSAYFLPECDPATGNFRSTQCYDVIDECWCVDPETGKRLAGSSGPTFGYATNCTTYEVETPCQRQREEHIRSNNTYVPSCDPVTGSFSPGQCDFDADFCWCVDVDTGRELPFRKVSPALRFDPGYECQTRTLPDPGCHFFGRPSIDSKQAVGRMPNCDAATDTYSRKQCDARSDECWCVDEYRQEFPESRSGPSWEFPNDCDNFGAAPYSTKCLREVRESQNIYLADSEPPDCDSLTGNYRPKQCVSLWYHQCWCVNVITGEQIAGTIMNEDTGFENDCTNVIPLNTTCLRMRAKFGDALKRDAYPRCSMEDGNFLPRQCTQNSPVVCWCVDVESGSRLRGSEMDEVRGYNVNCRTYVEPTSDDLTDAAAQEAS